MCLDGPDGHGRPPLHAANQKICGLLSFPERVEPFYLGNLELQGPGPSMHCRTPPTCAGASSRRAALHQPFGIHGLTHARHSSICALIHHSSPYVHTVVQDDLLKATFVIHGHLCGSVPRKDTELPESGESYLLALDLSRLLFVHTVSLRRLIP